MHLMYFVQYFPPEKASGLTIVTDMIEGLAKCGWKVDVYVPMPTRNVSDEVRKQYYKRRKETYENGKITIHRMRLYREGKGMLERTIRYTLFSMECLWVGLTKPSDAIFTGAAPPTQGLIGALIRVFTKKKFIYNPQDLFPDSLIVAGKTSERSIPSRIGRLLEKIAYNNADTIITISENMANTIKSRTRNKDKVKIIYNWCGTDHIAQIKRSDNKLFDELGLNRNAFYVVYAGNIGMLQKVETIVYAAELLKKERDIIFVIFGNGSEEEKIKSIIQDKQIDNIRMYPLLPQERVSEVYSLGNISIVSCRKGTGRIGMPSKMMTIMATRTPIVASFDLDSDLCKIINQFRCGICVEPENSEDLANGIMRLYRNPDALIEMGKNSRQCAETFFSKTKGTNEYNKLITDTLGME